MLKEIWDNRTKLVRALYQLRNETYFSNGSNTIETDIANEVYEKITSNIFADYISLDEENFITYKYSKSVIERRKKRIGSYLNTHFSHYPEVERDLYRNKLLSYLIDSVTGFQIVYGAEVTNAYRNEFGGNSCMTETPEYVLLYEKNPTKVGMLQYRGNISARALIWHTDEGETVIDRIYPNSGVHIDLFIKYAKENGYKYRTTQCTGESSFTDGERRFSYTVTLDNNVDVYPYIDTFIYGRIRNGKLILSNYCDDDYDLIFSDLCGCYEEVEIEDEDDF